MTSATFITHRNILLAMFLLVSLLCFSQTDRDYIRSGNKAFRKGNYSQAEVEYKKSLSVNPENSQALYNMGCALMMQKKNTDAVKYFQKSGDKESNKLRKSKSYHNIGVICQASKMYDNAIEAYSEALRNNPSDNETRYNLALCQKLRKNQNKDKKKDNDKDKNKNGGNKDKKEKQDKDKDKNENNKNEQKKQDQPQMSKDNAEQLLNAAMQQEQQTQQRLNKARQQQQTRYFEKNW